MVRHLGDTEGIILKASGSTEKEREIFIMPLCSYLIYCAQFRSLHLRWNDTRTRTELEKADKGGQRNEMASICLKTEQTTTLQLRK